MRNRGRPARASAPVTVGRGFVATPPPCVLTQTTGLAELARRPVPAVGFVLTGELRLRGFCRLFPSTPFSEQHFFMCAILDKESF